MIRPIKPKNTKLGIDSNTKIFDFKMFIYLRPKKIIMFNIVFAIINT
jgi:hypothetical protein